MMKRVLVLSKLFPNQTRPEEGIFILKQARELVKLTDVIIIAPVAVPLPRKKFKRTKEIISRIPIHDRLEGVECFRPRYFDFPRFSEYLNVYSMLLSILWCIRRNNLEVDLIHGHFAYPTGYVGVILARLLKKPFILTVHGSDIYILPQLIPHRRRIPFALRKSDLVITVSNALKKKVLYFGIPGEKVVTIYNGVDIKKFKPMDKAIVRKRLGLPTKGQIILFVGGLTQTKGVSYLIQAYSDLYIQNICHLLVLVGDGSLRRELEEEVKASGLMDNIIFVGEKAHDEIPWWMNACDVFVLPSLNEGFGIVSLEAMACGKPVVASMTGGIPEVVSDPSLGTLVEPANSRQLADTIADALNRKWNSASLVNYARQYSWEIAAQRIFNQYERISKSARI